MISEAHQDLQGDVVDEGTGFYAYGCGSHNAKMYRRYHGVYKVRFFTYSSGSCDARRRGSGHVQEDVIS